MYSNKNNINTLTALLVAHGVRHAVVCPGSRNAPIVHNLNECPDITVWPVTDERSAAFYALGMSQASDEPVAVCVTSGTAVLNTLPAVAEAYYQHRPLVVISADRPAAWIGQLDGQTLPQPGVLEPFVAMTVSLPEPHNDEERWHCNRMVNEALLAMMRDGRRPVHINVPTSEPLFDFTTAELPPERVVRSYAPQVDYDCLPQAFVDAVANAERPMVVFGQTSPHDFTDGGDDYLYSHVIVLHEALSTFPSVSHFDEVLARISDDELQRPDVVVHVGDTIVSKRLKRFLRQADDLQVWRITPSADVEDTFLHMTGIVTGDAENILNALSHKLRNHQNPKAMNYRRQWLSLLKAASQRAAGYEPPYSQMMVVKRFEEKLSSHPSPLTSNHFFVHYANSSAVRLANIYARHHVWCNRGVNGIEGSLSTAAGFSVVASASPSSPEGDTIAVAPESKAPSEHDSCCARDYRSPLGGRRGGLPALTFCVIGDLSFFYDQNALWNRNLNGALRILLLNNGKGGIFNMLPGLEQSPVRDSLISAEHQTRAEGICMQNAVSYRLVTNADELDSGIDWLLTTDSTRPMLLEVTTDAADDERALKDYLLSCTGRIISCT